MCCRRHHGHQEEHEEGEIHLTKEQIKTMNIQFGDFSKIKIGIETIKIKNFSFITTLFSFCYKRS